MEPIEETPPTLLEKRRKIPKERNLKIRPAHRAIFQKYKDGGFRSLSKAVRQTGLYSESLARKTDVLQRSKSWQALMAEYMPEEFLALRHSELLNKRDYRTVIDEDGKKHEVDNGPETNAISKGLELAYRLRGSFAKEEAPAPSTVMYNLFYKPEVREQMRVFEDGIKQSLLHEINKKNLADIEIDEENQSNLDRSGLSEPKEDTEQPTPSDGGGGGTTEPEVGISGGDDGGGISRVGQE